MSDLHIITKHESSDVATKLELNHRGEIVKQSKCARQTGTTVAMSSLFSTLPVRKREFQKNIKKEFARMCQIMQGYGLIASGCRIIVTNQTGKGSKATVLATNGSSAMLDNIVAVFGSKQKNDLLKIKQPIEPNETLTQEVLKSLDTSIDVREDDIDKLGLHRFHFDGFISSCSHGSGRSARDRQFIFINKRPCEPKQILKLINDVYHRYNVNQSPFVALNITVERSDVDVNLTPDKRQVLVNNETILKLALKKSLLSTFGMIPSALQMQNTLLSSTLPDFFKSEKNEQESVAGEESDGSSVDDDFARRFCSQKGDPGKFANALSQWRAPNSNGEGNSAKAAKRKCQPVDDIPQRCLKMKKIQEYLSQDEIPTEKTYSCKSEASSDSESEGEISRIDPPAEKTADSSFDASINESGTGNDDSVDKGFRVICKTKATDRVRTLKVEKMLPTSSKEAAEKTVIDIPEVPHKTATDEAENEENFSKISITIDEIRELAEKETELQEAELHRSKCNRMRFKTKIDPSKNKAAEQELRTEINKSDFVKMDIIGQFNLGFIIVRLDDDLFIVDQHASDEKYNFETLQNTTTLQNQSLVVPQALELTAVNESILIDNMKVFELNGFKFDVDMDQPITKRVKLIAKPFSKNWEFGKEDIDELLFMLQESDGDTSGINTCRPSRVRAMFASRACRSSVMIGTSLCQSDMRRLVDQMGTIEHPWVKPSASPPAEHRLILSVFRIALTDDQLFGIWSIWK